ncbi:MAG: hypothetical protein IKL48_00005 [Elusimicrobiaceae bacterium]|nr:hypothetical protein [Elusimicrobiaceae bacterium]
MTNSQGAAEKPPDEDGNRSGAHRRIVVGHSDEPMWGTPILTVERQEKHAEEERETR